MGNVKDMKKTRPVASLEQLFRALGDDTRLRILGLLASGETCVCHIHGALGIPQPMASRHLAYLRRMGLVATPDESDQRARVDVDDSQGASFGAP